MNTMQFEFDAVVAHLYKQGKPAMQEGKCRYRTDEGLMCAVGCRIPDVAYDHHMEGRGVGGVMGLRDMPDELREYPGMFRELQSLHDAYHTFGGITFEDYLDKHLPHVAETHKLIFVKPTQGATQ